MSRSTDNPWLHRFAVITALATLGLIGIGGLVTSHEAGMAVPDWPTSYGYNMFALPFKFWKGGVFYEHAHRLFASGVGLLTTILAVWLWLRESRCWLRWLGVIAFFAVVLQGVLGGLRVVLFKDQIGIFHATLAQLFFVLTCAIALFTSQWWRERGNIQHSTFNAEHSMKQPRAKSLGVECLMLNVECFPSLRRLFLFTTILIFLQLVLGATMRHQHAGLAIPDFPLAYGKLWPDTSAGAVARYNQQRMEINAVNPITPFQIKLQMAHRIMAVLILAAVAFCAWRIRSSGFSRSELSAGGIPMLKTLYRLVFFWLGLIFAQAGLGAATVLWNKPADIATAHVLVGALSLATGSLICIICFRNFETASRNTRVLTESEKLSRDEISFAARTPSSR